MTRERLLPRLQRKGWCHGRCIALLMLPATLLASWSQWSILTQRLLWAPTPRTWHRPLSTWARSSPDARQLFVPKLRRIGTRWSPVMTAAWKVVPCNAANYVVTPHPSPNLQLESMPKNNLSSLPLAGSFTTGWILGLGVMIVLARWALHLVPWLSSAPMFRCHANRQEWIMCGIQSEQMGCEDTQVMPSSQVN